MLPDSRKPTLPGKILWEEFLIPLGLSRVDFVERLGGTWTRQKLSAVIRGKQSITEEIALDFAEAFDTSPQFWMNLQANYNLAVAKKKRRRSVKRVLRKRRKGTAKSSF